jgi:lipopolysaccharide/colanic/teichoic acid biosynthesis glycosyltransferase
MKTTALLALSIAVAGRFMSDEIKSWCRWLHGKLRRIAVARLPVRCRERYDEEWESGLDEIPGEILKLVYSIGLIWAAAGIRSSVLKSTANAKRAFSPLKRLFDIMLSGIVLIFLFPMLAAIAIAIKLGSDGPVFYTSERVGKNGRVFRCIKFRTMTLGYENGHIRITRMGDPRITRLGNFLRKFSFEELPLLFNVLRADMSFIGPRAPIAGKVREHKQCSLSLLEVSPGLTGQWQIQPNPDPSTEERSSSVCAKKRSLWLDLKILHRTIFVVIAGTGSDEDHHVLGPDRKAP